MSEFTLTDADRETLRRAMRDSLDLSIEATGQRLDATHQHWLETAIEPVIAQIVARAREDARVWANGASKLRAEERARAEAAEAKLEAARKLHYPYDDFRVLGTPMCHQCRLHAWPCPTVEALGMTEEATR